jgi:hypothetical protein
VLRNINLLRNTVRGAFYSTSFILIERGHSTHGVLTFTAELTPEIAVNILILIGAIRKAA